MGKFEIGIQNVDFETPDETQFFKLDQQFFHNSYNLNSY